MRLGAPAAHRWCCSRPLQEAVRTMQPIDDEPRILPVGNGSEVGYWDSGRGEPIMLVHAGVFSDWFLPLSRELPRDRFRVVRTRRAGYRGTARPNAHLSLADHARHAARLLDALETGPVHWVGHSSGSLI